jgi:hypothetical protein
MRSHGQGHRCGLWSKRFLREGYRAGAEGWDDFGVQLYRVCRRVSKWINGCLKPCKRKQREIIVDKRATATVL